ncbi:nicotinate (nicotinamide) nucleotide adenylyltransferase [Arcobacter nitrofigilis DSM 7299]|uniref:Probable nicotinate-nucleotide adenylyltransferase n=1 Tax=Arcobacter nitrofigilis (strain ATCC 33309 / DSM 7299 / CCUG 15893 / LMG 7604 / NCTC 12251 / CI) TaxID=572480 RepID=D5V5Q0_ARCNC|nr:nicotinate (nicotinamide) nucleotide adenylyltransferase [Arcobacter nitrofigilis]ADG92086.1 nicotinate (nicotinamide) nucleotide adenylyltransferase [Arcobacter nitrofigilis DSM 7299]
MQIAIFGGSFDPVHIAHETIVIEALNKLDLDLIILVPTFLNPQKITSHLSPNERLYLLSKNFKDHEKVIVSDYEINKNRPVYSIETIQYLKEHYKPDKTYFIIGADNYEKLNTWYKVDEILDEVELVVVTRNGFCNDIYDNILTLDVDIDISSTELRKNLDLSFVPDKIKDDVKKFWH